jgi:hypothetical protein
MCSGRMAVVAVVGEGKLFFLMGRNRERRLPMVSPAAEGHPQWVYWIPKRSFHALHVVSNAFESLNVSTLSSLLRSSECHDPRQEDEGRRGGEEGDKRENVLIDEPPYVRFTMRFILRSKELMCMPDEVDVKCWHEEVGRGRRQKI